MISATIVLAAAAARPDQACAATAVGSPAILAVDGTRLAYGRCGSGTPTIVFEGGFGGNLENWKTLFPLVGRFAPVFAYSRPGFRGSSEHWRADADGMRTSDEAARLLRHSLRVAGVRPPYVLVGHSLGGLYIQKFAQLFPRDTAGLVLMDNRPAPLMKRCAAEGYPECQNNAVSPDWSAALQSTFRGIEPSEAVAPTAKQLGDLPILLITAGSAEEGLSKSYYQRFRRAQVEFAAQLHNSKQVFIPAATHSSLSGEQATETASAIEAFWRTLPQPKRK